MYVWGGRRVYENPKKRSRNGEGEGSERESVPHERESQRYMAMSQGTESTPRRDLTTPSTLTDTRLPCFEVETGKHALR